METVTVAQLKARLSHYLREVRAGGAFTVVSHDIPVATLGPHDAGRDDDVVVVAPHPDAPPLSCIDMGPPLGVDADVVELVRQGRRDAGDSVVAIDDPERGAASGKHS
jgi:prevent-host-death family protein